MKPHRQRQPKPAAPQDISMPDVLDPELTTNQPMPSDISRLLSHLPVTVPRHHTRILRLMDRLVRANRLCGARVSNSTTFWDIAAPTPADVLPNEAQTAEFLLGHLDGTPRPLAMLLQDQADVCPRCRGPGELKPVMTVVLGMMATQGVVTVSTAVTDVCDQTGIAVGWCLTAPKGSSTTP
jgi:hypothetical protein